MCVCCVSEIVVKIVCYIFDMVVERMWVLACSAARRSRGSRPSCSLAPLPFSSNTAEGHTRRWGEGQSESSFYSPDIVRSTRLYVEVCVCAFSMCICVCLACVYLVQVRGWSGSCPTVTPRRQTTPHPHLQPHTQSHAEKKTQLYACKQIAISYTRNT